MAIYQYFRKENTYQNEFPSHYNKKGNEFEGKKKAKMRGRENTAMGKRENSSSLEEYLYICHA